MSTPALVLGLETSCDETSVALLRQGAVVANKVYSQEVHEAYGGVVPEIASRAHLLKIEGLCRAVLSEAGVTPPQLDLIAVTDSPGLAGALLVGVSFGLGLSCGFGIAATGVNHLEGHMASVTLEHADLPFPFLALVVSGGHTALYTVHAFGSYHCLGRTVDDAAGEAFDKVGKLLGFGYPAGRAIESEAQRHINGNLIQFPVARVSSDNLDFSYSGLKTAVKYFVEEKGTQYARENRPLICRSFQRAVIESLVRNTLAAVRRTGIRRVALVGGVACNQALRAALTAAQKDVVVRYPAPSLCVDNAAMVAKAGYELCRRGLLRKPEVNPCGEVPETAPDAPVGEGRAQAVH